MPTVISPHMRVMQVGIQGLSVWLQNQTSVLDRTLGGIDHPDEPNSVGNLDEQSHSPC